MQHEMGFAVAWNEISCLLLQGKETQRVKLAETGEVLEVDETDLEKVSHVTVR